MLVERKEVAGRSQADLANDRCPPAWADSSHGLARATRTSGRWWRLCGDGGSRSGCNSAAPPRRRPVARLKAFVIAPERISRW